MLLMMVTTLDPRRGRGNAKKKKKSLSKQRKFHQVKVTSPFLLNKIMATTNYRTAEECSFYINYKTIKEGSFYKLTTEQPR